MMLRDEKCKKSQRFPAGSSARNRDNRSIPASDDKIRFDGLYPRMVALELRRLFRRYRESAGSAFRDRCHFARWLQKKVELVDSSVTAVAAGGYGPDRQWFGADASGTLQGTIRVFSEDGATTLATGSINLSAGKSYALVLQ